MTDSFEWYLQKETKTPKHSLAVGADVQFACPPAIGLLNTEEQHDDQMETPSINQMLYAAVNKGTNEMELCAWALDEDLLSLKNPTATIKVKLPHVAIRGIKILIIWHRWINAFLAF